MTAEPSLIRTLYHGTTRASAEALCGGDRVDFSRCTPVSDFGCGFYMTSSLLQARDWAALRAARDAEGGVGAVICFQFNWWETNNLRILCFANSREHDDPNGFWEIVHWCRRAKPLPVPSRIAPTGDHDRPNTGWDIVIGPVARFGPKQFKQVDVVFDQIAFVSDPAIAMLTGNLLMVR